MNGCTVTWVEADPSLPHALHACVFEDAVHTRHECRCGLDFTHREVAS